MKRRPGKGAARLFGSTKFKDAAMKTGPGRVASRAEKSALGEPVYVFPTIEGPDAEYVKVISGKVTDRRPSFV